MNNDTHESNDIFSDDEKGVANTTSSVDNAEVSAPEVKVSEPKPKRATGRASGAKTGKKAHKERVPMHIRQPIQAAPREGYRRRVVKNDLMRVERLKMAGYTVVEDGTAIGDHKEGQAASPGSASAKIVNPSSGGWGVLMEIPEDMYQADLKAKHDKIDRDEEALITAGAEEVGGNVGERAGKINL